ncbi:MAG TPA: NAD(P)-binding protein [Syntrophales bacterium]|nr:NAD(P)-binding protein [Syntrophales bacterium]HOU78262.1 NAD(P)-binding protein [Syntrophales bacterium]HPC31551.1 NAD(P)-binding protein [Syntrophales bacterium]HQG34792.1 NAD(P)-binding protein [Syntrophales bacterium]HQI34854.1 NAD(P)-binding protein [Syntrophales bacterium]
MINDNEKIGAVMVVGSGIAGIQASLDLANSGLKVYLVEKDISIGGVMAQLDKTFPTNDCSACILSPKLVEVGRHPNVEILTRRTVNAVEGEAGKFKVRMTKAPRFIDLNKCTGCGDCAKVCPINVPSDFNENLSERQATYRKFPQAIPSGYAIDKLGTSPCKAACPTHISVQGYVALIAAGKYKEALKLIKKDNPFPIVCGRVCNHPCETACMRGKVEEPIDIMHLKRFVADLDLKDETRFIPEKKESKGKKIAVVGAGPAGLTCAYYLAAEGYDVEVFESLPVAGGWLAVGIPEYRLPKDVLRAEIKVIEDLGVKIHLNTAVGKDIPFAKLQSDFDAVFIGCGTVNSSKLNIPGEDLQGVIHGVDYLKRVNLGEKVFLGDKVAVVGGGNVAMDAVRTAIRTGSKDVFILYRRSRAEMPASPEEIEEALEEGIKMEFLVAPKRVVGENGKVTGVECTRMELGEPDASGRRRPVEIKGSEFIVPCDALIPAIGQEADLDFVPKESGISINKWKNFEVDPVTFATTTPGVFAGGDVVTGPATVVKAVYAGKEAAVSIDRYLRGEDVAAGRAKDWTKGLADKADVSKVAKVPRRKYPHMKPEDRRTNFQEVGIGFTEEEAVAEAKRCLACGICSECYQCVEACIAGAINHDDTFEEETIEVGAVIAAPGFEVFDARLRGEYGFGIYQNVVTSIQFERILSASGPYFGHVQRISDGREPKKIAFIQCVGSRDTSCGNSWCSSVCCMYATKEAIIGKEHAKELEPTIFFMDIRAHGKDFDRFVNRAKDEYGIRYIRSMPSTIKELQQSKNLLLKYVQEDGSLIEEEFDMVVLSVGLCPPPEAAALAQALGIELEEHGFCKTALENPVETTRNGVFVCGAFGGPKDIPETVMEASGAAACAAGILAARRGTMITEEELPLESDLRGLGPRTGVFVCHCGINIGGVVNVPEVVEYCKTLPNVVFATDNLFTCSQDTAVKMGEVIKEQNLTRVVVASCSPRTHEGLFQENCEKAGLNRYLFEMANIRDQNSWVHMHEPEEATEKAKDLVRMAVAKAQFLKPLKPGQLTVNHATLIIGGGLAGITAALSLADQGYESYIVEKEPVLGGNYRKLYYTLEGLDTRKHLKSLLDRVQASKLIHAYTGATIKKIEGFIGNYKTTITTRDGEEQFEHGVVIVATGGYELETKEYLYGQSSQVVTQRELEKLIAEKEDKALKARSVTMIQCVGSRIPERPYCSRYCCSEAMKNALKLKELDPTREVTIVYRDIRTFGLKEDYYKKARELNVRFIRYDEDRKPEVIQQGDQLSLRVFDPVMNAPVEFKTDLLALSVGTVPNPENEEIGKMLKVPTNQDGFFLEAHVKLRPVDFATDGVFMCGMAHAPKLSEDAIVQANAAVSRASTILTKDFIEAEGKTAYVNKERCAACGLCEQNCPFGAISVNVVEACAEVNTVLCKGCGVCTASCRMNAVDLNGFTNEEELEQIYNIF